jgi:hypothetical protein
LKSLAQWPRLSSHTDGKSERREKYIVNALRELNSLKKTCRGTIFHCEEPALDVTALNMGISEHQRGRRHEVGPEEGEETLLSPPSHCVSQGRALPLWASPEQ